MGFRGRPPRGGVGGTWWSFDKVQAGDTRTGWMAGDIHCVHCHCSKRSQPCVKVLLGDNAECQCDDTPTPPKPLGFVPLWRHDGKPTVVVIREHQFESVAKIKLHRYCLWGRVKGSGESVSITENVIDRPWETTLPEKRKPADLSHWLCVLWRRPDLEPALRESLFLSDNVVSPTAPMTGREVADKMRDIDADGRKQAASLLREQLKVRGKDPALIGELFPGPSSNGTGHK
jgi:hypothetical protein